MGNNKCINNLYIYLGINRQVNGFIDQKKVFYWVIVEVRVGKNVNSYNKFYQTFSEKNSEI